VSIHDLLEKEVPGLAKKDYFDYGDLLRTAVVGSILTGGFIEVSGAREGKREAHKLLKVLLFYEILIVQVEFGKNVCIERVE